MVQIPTGHRGSQADTHALHGLSGPFNDLVDASDFLTVDAGELEEGLVRHSQLLPPHRLIQGDEPRAIRHRRVLEHHIRQRNRILHNERFSLPVLLVRIRSILPFFNEVRVCELLEVGPARHRGEDGRKTGDLDERFFAVVSGQVHFPLVNAVHVHGIPGLQFVWMLKAVDGAI